MEQSGGSVVLLFGPTPAQLKFVHTFSSNFSRGDRFRAATAAGTTATTAATTTAAAHRTNRSRDDYENCFDRGRTWILFDRVRMGMIVLFEPLISADDGFSFSFARDDCCGDNYSFHALQSVFVIKCVQPFRAFTGNGIT